ncbi:MAG: hypothetical protein CTY31_13310 [Hyphomicrobium sp.]|nr:MAG: hypothetical protein CTY39_04545 [Hyphomicrobium sp.]PPC98383.1 MAG: hypothetical protein CTY31_13310 [Hyphomicrobium sp.]
MSPASRLLAVAVMAVLPFTHIALAADDIVKPAPTPMPSAGPTIAAATEFCGDAPGKAEELIKRYSTDSKLKQVFKSVDYVAYGDDEKNATVMYSFTASGHPAYPAAVCRRVVKEGDNLVIKMMVVCDGAEEPCAKLRNDFNVMNAKMQVEVNQKIAADKK